MLAKRIKQLRLELGLTQKELGEKIGVNDNAITNYEKGNREPDNATICKLAEIFGCTTDYLLGLTNAKNNVIIKNENIPEELKPYIDAISIDKDKVLTPEDIKGLIQAAIPIKQKN
jgi:transcriptional regulator with XRE-family HTH domain